MTFHAATESRPAAGLDGTVYVLTGKDCRAEVWPAKGFNCYRWTAAWAGQALDLLHADPAFFGDGKPTRTGVPILFPFPNRVREGRFMWNGKEYSVPLNSGKNAIHGFCCYKPWRVVDHGADNASAWVTGEFTGSLDAPEAKAFWPADYRLRVTYRLLGLSLRIEATVANPDGVTLPFGLGYHPYLRVPFLAGDRVEQYWVESSAREMWALEEGVPTGRRMPPPSAQDLRHGKRFTELTLDDLFTDLEAPGAASSDALFWRAALRQPERNLEVQLLTTAQFRELVLFTPPHRQAIAIEPYTCATDAINMQHRGIDAGLIVLQPGETWRGAVEFVVGAM